VRVGAGGYIGISLRVLIAEGEEVAGRGTVCILQKLLQVKLKLTPWERVSNKNQISRERTPPLSPILQGLKVSHHLLLATASPF
jgi:hypothetical protein